MANALNDFGLGVYYHNIHIAAPHNAFAAGDSFTSNRPVWDQLRRSRRSTTVEEIVNTPGVCLCSLLEQTWSRKAARAQSAVALRHRTGAGRARAHR